ncbi:MULTISPECIES: NAD(P)/FAD-dependent oxidoreductase [Brucella]|uniref:Thioredoxin reductase n=1 Tax=Brucella lupini TaxID=255457 RepID=A0A256GCA8_9HYPH|nr:MULTISPECIES: NAD(P)/FAD-dependent oxidoreductase [Brucella]RNL46260.1 NAD(P)/FAD-dependent oxidoreductase [Ochrobactrum sp. MH181795]KAB2706552.1 NAD(P)/FAD-dependent oxidoreductase [Brucella lupini]KAB2725563.1 NAD(P)/FAD-dependent oxidoreductase [Brucella anthropi]KAB2742874.1 NAD(P)/FAD-dependent oxidoreductase [Brucella anthropi]KAB2798064.1 NAD(P)/FAD-dependent oxidoreductase [Brucella anthropi]
MHHDAIIIGGSFAGLSAATYLARGRRSVRVIDAGKPRNRFAEYSHGFFAQDGSNPLSMLETAKAQVEAYPTVRFTQGKAVSGSGEIDNFAIELDSGEIVEGRRLILAFGISDELPDIPGLAERWGNSVIHCPYCHGYEFSDRQLGVLNMSPMSVHQAMLISEWGSTTFFIDKGLEPDAEAFAELERRGVKIEHSPVRALHGEGIDISEIELEDGRLVPLNALYIGPRNWLNSQIADTFGCAMDELPLGRTIQTDGLKTTTVPGIFAAGDITRGAHSVAWSVADGVTAGTAAHRSLVF